MKKRHMYSVGMVALSAVNSALWLVNGLRWDDKVLPLTAALSWLFTTIILGLRVRKEK